MYENAYSCCLGNPIKQTRSSNQVTAWFGPLYQCANFGNRFRFHSKAKCREDGKIDGFGRRLVSLCVIYSYLRVVV